MSSAGYSTQFLKDPLYNYKAKGALQDSNKRKICKEEKILSKIFANDNIGSNQATGYSSKVANQRANFITQRVLNKTKEKSKEKSIEKNIDNSQFIKEKDKEKERFQARYRRPQVFVKQKLNSQTSLASMNNSKSLYENKDNNISNSGVSNYKKYINSYGGYNKNNRRNYNNGNEVGTDNNSNSNNCNNYDKHNNNNNNNNTDDNGSYNNNTFSNNSFISCCLFNLLEKYTKSLNNLQLTKYAKFFLRTINHYKNMSLQSHCSFIKNEEKMSLNSTILFIKVISHVSVLLFLGKKIDYCKLVLSVGVEAAKNDRYKNDEKLIKVKCGLVNNIAAVYFLTENYVKSELFLDKCLEMGKSEIDTAITYNNYALVEYYNNIRNNKDKNHGKTSHYFHLMHKEINKFNLVFDEKNGEINKGHLRRLLSFGKETYRLISFLNFNFCYFNLHLLKPSKSEKRAEINNILENAIKFSVFFLGKSDFNTIKLLKLKGKNLSEVIVEGGEPEFEVFEEGHDSVSKGYLTDLINLIQKSHSIPNKINKKSNKNPENELDELMDEEIETEIDVNDSGIVDNLKYSEIDNTRHNKREKGPLKSKISN